MITLTKNDMKIISLKAYKGKIVQFKKGYLNKQELIFELKKCKAIYQEYTGV